MTIMHSSSLEFKWVRLQHSFKHHTYSLIFLSLAFSLLHCSHLSCSVFILSLIQLHSPSSEVKMSPSGSLCVPSDTNGSLAVTAFVTVSRKGMSEVVAHQSKAFARHSQRAYQQFKISKSYPLGILYVIGSSFGVWCCKESHICPYPRARTLGLGDISNTRD